MYSFSESNTQSSALPYLLILFSLLFLFLANQTLRMFSQRMSGKAFCFLVKKKLGKVPDTKVELLLFQFLMKRKCELLVVFIFLVNLKSIKIAWANTW